MAAGGGGATGGVDLSSLFPSPSEVCTPVSRTRVGSWRLCARGFGRGCPCCSDDWPVPPATHQSSSVRRGRGLDLKWGPSSAVGSGDAAKDMITKPVSKPPFASFSALFPSNVDGQSLAAVLSRLPAAPAAPAPRFLDTHCHLEEVLQVIRRHNVAPSLSKQFHELNPVEAKHWRTLGWLQDAGGSLPPVPDPDPKEPTVPKNATWQRRWADLKPEQQSAARALGYEVVPWEKDHWFLPHVKWDDLTEDQRRNLLTLDETPESWNSWNGGGGAKGGSGGPGSVVDSNDLRTWDALTRAEQDAATGLGFTRGSWNSDDMADLEPAIRDYFGDGFDGCITQGCDLESLDNAAFLAKSHPKIWVSFGCHPKAAWSYNDELEQKMLSYAKACGNKTVAWGEFGLDFSHPYYGKHAANRRTQKDVFARQLKLAVGLGYPLVIHSRGADRDTLRMMRKWVPKHWKVHVHSYRGSVQFMEAIIEEWDNAFIGIPGIITMPDPDSQELCRRCPLERMVLETDAPYLPIFGNFFSHPGLVSDITRKVAELKGVPASEVFAMMRKNATLMYGI